LLPFEIRVPTIQLLKLMERADTVNRQSIMETVEKVAVHPIGRLEERIGALEQDMAVVRFQLKGRAYFFPAPVR
jgi:hypothetical protein